MLTAGTWWGNNDSDSAIVLHRLSYPAVRGFCVFLQDKMHRRSSCEQRERQKKRKPHRLILIFIIVCILERYSQFDNSEKRQRRFERVKVEVYCRWKTTFEHFNRVKPTVVRKELLKRSRQFPIIDEAPMHSIVECSFSSNQFVIETSEGKEETHVHEAPKTPNMKVSIFFAAFSTQNDFQILSDFIIAAWLTCFPL